MSFSNVFRGGWPPTFASPGLPAPDVGEALLDVPVAEIDEDIGWKSSEEGKSSVSTVPVRSSVKFPESTCTMRLMVFGSETPGLSKEKAHIMSWIVVLSFGIVKERVGFISDN